MRKLRKTNNCQTVKLKKTNKKKTSTTFRLWCFNSSSDLSETFLRACQNVRHCAGGRDKYPILCSLDACSLGFFFPPPVCFVPLYDVTLLPVFMPVLIVTFKAVQVGRSSGLLPILPPTPPPLHIVCTGSFSFVPRFLLLSLPLLHTPSVLWSFIIQSAIS